jgi:hypothetical protein
MTVYDTNFAQNKIRCVKNSCLNNLFEFFRIVGRITTYNFIKINIITPTHVYYMIVQLKLRYDYFITLILHKT